VKLRSTRKKRGPPRFLGAAARVEAGQSADEKIVSKLTSGKKIVNGPSETWPSSGSIPPHIIA
jgi:hypothetical protein